MPSLFQSFRACLSLLVLTGLCRAGHAQTTPPQPALYATYIYAAYTVYDESSPDPATQVPGVSGTLTLRPAGTYQKDLIIAGTTGLRHFKQSGTFTCTGDSIRFAFADAKGADVQRGIIRLDSVARHLTLTIFGYPTGNKGVYELVAAKASAAPATLPLNRPAAPPLTRPKIRHPKAVPRPHR